jgi:hypothetical protein
MLTSWLNRPFSTGEAGAAAHQSEGLCSSALCRASWLTPNPQLTACLPRPLCFLHAAVPAGRFPVELQLWDRSGKLVRQIASLPLAEDIPIAFNAVRTGACEQGGRGWVGVEQRTSIEAQ